jgi:hypothetical protein
MDLGLSSKVCSINAVLDHLRKLPWQLPGILVAGLAIGGCGAEPVATDRQFELAAERADTAALLAGLEQIKAWHQSHATGLAEKLRPGLSEETIASAFADLDCHPTDELRILWSWRDGAMDTTPFIWYHDFLSLEDAISARWLLRLAALAKWNRRLVPVFAFDGEWYATYCGTSGTVAAPIVHLTFEDEPHVTYVNLTSFVVTMAQAMSEKAVRWEDGGMFEDIHALERIHRLQNPGYAFPYYVPALSGND